MMDISIIVKFVRDVLSLASNANSELIIVQTVNQMHISIMPRINASLVIKCLKIMFQET